ncbi:MAG TPA: hypothetical protein VH062_03570 [Polyangiaceae bacterium]|jgi:hypothetical protein|nr:hypothetical protein [Polyangiaceae bacterium]
MRLPFAACLAALPLVACSSTPPPHWAEGGARLDVGPAEWRTGDDAVIEILPDGKVTVGGAHIFTIDAAGRIYDSENEAVGIVLPDGNIVGPNDTHLGRVGVSNASPPGGGTAWLSVMPDGHVTHYDPDGERSFDGAWQGCSGPRLRTCTLVSHLYTLERVSRASSPGMFIGVGVGVGI